MPPDPFASAPVGAPGLLALAAGMAGFAIALLVARLRVHRGPEADARRAPASTAGFGLQALGIGLAGVGDVRAVLPAGSPPALAAAALVAMLMAGAIMLFVWATRAMGRNWSIVARTRADHRLVTDGPFAHIRHPIYVALFLVLIAIAVATGHWHAMWLALPAYAIGTAIRIRLEEALLRHRFGAAYDGYARRVNRFVPGLF